MIRGNLNFLAYIYICEYGFYLREFFARGVKFQPNVFRSLSSESKTTFIHVTAG